MPKLRLLKPLTTLVLLVGLIVSAKVEAADSSPATDGNTEVAVEALDDWQKLADELEPSDETEAVRLARQRAENAAVKLFTLPTAPIDASVVRYRTSFYPVLHDAITRFRTARDDKRTHAEIVAAAAQDEADRLALVPGLVAAQFAVFRKPRESMDDAENLLSRQSSFYAAALERIAALRIYNAGGFKATNAEDAPLRVDFLAIGAVASRVVDPLARDSARLDLALDGLGFTPSATRAAAVTALRSLGGPAPSAAQLAELGLPEGSPAAQAVASLGAVVLPFALRAMPGDDDEFATRFLAELHAEAASSSKLEVDLQARSATPAEAATLLVYLIKRVGVDPQLAAVR